MRGCVPSLVHPRAVFLTIRLQIKLKKCKNTNVLGKKIIESAIFLNIDVKSSSPCPVVGKLPFTCRKSLSGGHS